MKKPVLHVQKMQHTPLLIDDFCYSAQLGARLANIKCKTFRDSLTIPFESTSIIVGSVEQCHIWLEASGFGIPQAIPLEHFHPDHLGRKIERKHISEVYARTFAEWKNKCYKKVFIKPSQNIKAFTGFVMDDPRLLRLWSEKFEGEVYEQEVVDIISEYRLYVSQGKILGLFNYAGDCLIFPDAELIKTVKYRADDLEYLSYTLDFGVLNDGRTILIEANDGYAIGNYGLEPHDY